MVQAQVQEGRNPRVSLKGLLEAGVHFGHQKNRWNPKMKPYIFTERNGIHILDLQQTVPMLEQAHEFISEITSKGGHILFVGTKKQAQDIVQREAERSGQFYVNRRWLGGTLTNFVTIRQRLRHLKQLRSEDESGAWNVLPKQEAAAKQLELDKLERTLGGMREMTQLPGALFIIDPKREHLAVHEAQRLGIPTIAMVDSNSDPNPIDMVLPANDDAIRSIRLISSGIAQAAINGRTERESLDGEAEDFAQAIENEDVFAGSEEKTADQDAETASAQPAARV
ncbi:MAG: SSU ribosomal protein S2p (SAe) [uncultured Thermomicrobiales bacterium]|uniref:Small ribosomal subunit protein uS2 n=1 Tax=uncultured Thermomicrobiales bacterium TaxID=1645740 RepID=A0A6J4UZ34_9BACT|nr:MAG: SSU ribosomal protein S2p (SAe) [uncultured Thermomicrobiales bacterium]